MRPSQPASDDGHQHDDREGDPENAPDHSRYSGEPRERGGVAFRRVPEERVGSHVPHRVEGARRADRREQDLRDGGLELRRDGQERERRDEAVAEAEERADVDERHHEREGADQSDHRAGSRTPLAQHQEGRAPEEASEIARVENHEGGAAPRPAHAALVGAEADRLDGAPGQDRGEPVRDLVQEHDEDPERVDDEAVPEQERGHREGERQQQAARRGFQNEAYFSASRPFCCIHAETSRIRARNWKGGSNGTGPAVFAAASTSADSLGSPLSP